jgi:hypothetical protein
MVSIDMVKDGAAYYVDRNIMSKYPVDGWQKVVAGSVTAMAINSFAEKIRHNPDIKALGLISDEGIDIDSLAMEIKRRMPNSGLRVTIPMFGEAVFYEADINDLVEVMKGRR